MNKVILLGNICSDMEPRTTASGIAQCTFRIAVSRRFANQQGVRESDFFTIICWRQTADFAQRYFRKGMRVLVEGSIQNRSYDAQDGTKRYVTEIIADNLEFGGNKNDNNSAPRTDYSQPTPPPEQHYAKNDAGNFAEIDDDELPF